MWHAFEAELAVRGNDRIHLLQRVRPGDAESAFARLDCLVRAGVITLDDAAAVRRVLQLIGQTET